MIGQLTGILSSSMTNQADKVVKCPVVEQFWSELTDILEVILNVYIPQCPAVC